MTKIKLYFMHTHSIRTTYGTQYKLPKQIGELRHGDNGRWLLKRLLNTQKYSVWAKYSNFFVKPGGAHNDY
jgi:hypothetical protein